MIHASCDTGIAIWIKVRNNAYENVLRDDISNVDINVWSNVVRNVTNNITENLMRNVWENFCCSSFTCRQLADAFSMVSDL